MARSMSRIGRERPFAATQRYVRSWSTSRHCADIVNVSSLPSRPGEFHPKPLTDPDVNLSIHPARVTAPRLPPSADVLGSSQFDPVGPSQRR